jgi:hypothetical protein
LFAYDAPEIERRRLILEEFCRSFEGSNMQSTDDQRLLFEKLREGLAGTEDGTKKCHCTFRTRTVVSGAIEGLHK